MHQIEIGSRILTFEGGDRLSVANSWKGYVIGVGLAVAVFVLGLICIACHVLVTGLTAIVCGLLFLYCALFGSEPYVFDRAAGTISHGRRELCKIRAVHSVRVVLAPGGPMRHYGGSGSGIGRRATGGVGRRTGVFLNLKSAPWSIELDCFSRDTTAWDFALPIAEFLGVDAVDAPIGVPRRRPDKPGPPGFPVVLPPKSGE